MKMNLDLFVSYINELKINFIMPKKLLWKETSKLKFNSNSELKDWYS
jgi:hypothetical protein